MTENHGFRVCWHWPARLAGFALLLAGVVGCGGTGSVTGSVTFKPKNKKLVWGSVTMIGRDSIPRAGHITPDGTYTVNGLPTGEVKILVSSDNPKGDAAALAAAKAAGRGGDRKPPAPGEAADVPTPVPEEVAKAWFPIPEKYADVTKSSLKTTVIKGTNTYDILLD